jgi:hypothetical protein
MREAMNHLRSTQGPDFREGCPSFVEMRAPKFNPF